MGQATVDLPDPLYMPPPASLAGTDDLLAQLAGDEIDRLLAEADAGSPRVAPALVALTPASGPDVAPSADGNTTAEAVSPAVPAAVGIPQAATPLEPVANPAAPAGAASTQVSGADDELDTLLSKLTESGAAVAPAQTDAAPRAPETVQEALPTVPERAKTLTEQVPEVLAQFGEKGVAPSGAIPTASGASAAPAESDGLMSAAERDALRIGDLAAEAAAADRQDAAAVAITSTGAADEKPSRLATPAIKLLEWVNAPLSFVPDPLRDTLGKVAILTLVNSVAVLIYVLFVRH